MDIKKARETRASLVEQARAILDAVDGRALTAEEQQQYDRIDSEIDSLCDTITRMESASKREERLREEVEITKPIPNQAAEFAAKKENVEVNSHPRGSEEYRAAFTSVLRNGINGLSADERRALSAGTDTAGGYVTAPIQMATGLIKAVDNDVFIRRYATKYTLDKAQSLGAVSFDTDIADPTWTSEIGVGSEDSSMAFGKRELTPNPLAQYIKVSNEVIRAAAIDLEGFVKDRMRYKFSVVHEANFMTGTGAKQPLGLFTASNHGISTTYDVSTDNAATALTADGLIECKYALKPQYMAKARWIFHRNGVKKIRKLKDGEGQYLWRQGLSTDKPDTILDVPYDMSEYCPDTWTSGQYVGIIGDFSFYWIVDSLDMTIQRLIELYAATNQVGFIARWQTDAAPVLGEAFRRVTLG